MRPEVRVVAAVVAPLLLLTVVAAALLARVERREEGERLRITAEGLAGSVATQLERFDELGLDVRAALGRLGPIDELDGQTYTGLLDDMQVEERFPGLFGVSLVREVAREDLDAFVAERRREDPGFRMSSDAAVLSGMTRIVQLPPDAPGAVLYVPLTSDPVPAWLGLVFAGDPFLAELEPLPAAVAVRIVDPQGHDFQQFGWLGGSPPATALVGALVWTPATREQRARQLVALRTAELAEANRALADAQQAKDRFLATVSHELKTPLTVISGFVSSIRRVRPDDHDLESLLDPIERNVSRLRALVDDLLTLASLEAGAVEPTPERIELAPVLASAPRELAGLDHLNVAVEATEETAVEADRRHLDRILTNLLVNAARYGAAPLELRARPDGDAVTIEVRDHGGGLGEDGTRLFDRFVRGHDTAGGGTGLGLAIVRELAELNGGEVRYEPAEPGARFVVSLPAAGRRTPPPAAGDVRPSIQGAVVNDPDDERTGGSE